MLSPPPQRPQRPVAPQDRDPVAIAYYVRNLMAWYWHVEKQKNFTASFFRDNCHADFFREIDTSTPGNNKVLGKAERDALEWDVLRLVSMMFCAHPSCLKKYKFNERGELFCQRHVIPAHFPEFAHLIGAKGLPEEVKRLIYDVSRPYVDFALIGDFADSKEEWMRVQADNSHTRPSRSSRCPNFWVPTIEVPLPQAAQAYLDSLPEPVESTSQADALATLSSTFRTSTPGSFTSATLNGLKDSGGDAVMKDFSPTPSLEGTFIPSDLDLDMIVRPPSPGCPLGSYIQNGTGEVLDPRTHLPLPAEMVFGVPEHMLRPKKAELPLDDLFSLPTTLPLGFRFQFSDEPTPMQLVIDNFGYNFMSSPPWQEAY